MTFTATVDSDLMAAVSSRLPAQLSLNNRPRVDSWLLSDITHLISTQCPTPTPSRGEEGKAGGGGLGSLELRPIFFFYVQTGHNWQSILMKGNLKMTLVSRLSTAQL